MTEIQYVWEHWKFNADQRIKAFNFFVVFAIFADGGLFAALDKGAHPIVFTSIGVLIVALAAAFWVIDIRSERLIRLSEPGLLAFESSLGDVSRLFHADTRNRRSWIRYKNSFRSLFFIQIVFGLTVATFGALAWQGTVARDVFSARPAGEPAMLEAMAMPTRPQAGTTPDLLVPPKAQPLPNIGGLEKRSQAN